MPQSFPHDPADKAPYFVDFGDKGNQVEVCGQITSVTWVLNGQAATDLTVEFQSNDGLKCKVIISGGSAGTTYSVTCVAVLGTGDEECTLSRSIELVCAAQ